MSLPSSRISTDNSARSANDDTSTQESGTPSTSRE